VAAAAGAQPADPAAAEPAPQFEAVPRIEKLEYYPCSQCHDVLEPDATRRELSAPHDIEAAHGKAEFWCLVCHTLKDRDHLHTLDDRLVTFDQAYMVCEQCHQQRARDWRHGAHGKRVSGWSGKRTILSCPECHNPHSPAIAPRKPKPPPPPRIGFPMPQDEVPQKVPLWQVVGGEERRPAEGTDDQKQ